MSLSSNGSVGSDLFSAYNYSVHYGQTIKIKTDLGIHVPNGCYGLITGRSSLTLKGIQTHAGMLDSNFRGVVCVILTNNLFEVFNINKGHRIGQIAILKYEKPKWFEIEKFQNLIHLFVLAVLVQQANKKMTDYDEKLVEKALVELLVRKNGRKSPPKLLQLAGKIVYYQIINVLEKGIWNEDNICFCKSTLPALPIITAIVTIVVSFASFYVNFFLTIKNIDG